MNIFVIPSAGEAFREGTAARVALPFQADKATSKFEPFRYLHFYVWDRVTKGAKPSFSHQTAQGLEFHEHFYLTLGVLFFFGPLFA